jgi:probably membrane protein
MEKGKKTIDKNSIRFTIMAVVLIAIFCFAISPVTLQNDTFYTIKIGEHILQNGIDMKDPFSWHENLQYTYPHWLYDVVIYLVYNIGGQVGIYISTIVLSIALGLTMYLVNTKLTKNKLTSFVLTIGAMYLLRNYIAARAQLVTFILFILTVYFIEMFLETKKKRYAVGLIIIPIIIANVHLAVFPFYFVLYLPYIAEYMIYILSNTEIILVTAKIDRLNKKILKTTKEEEIQKIKDEINRLEQKNEKTINKKEKINANPYKIKIRGNNNVKALIIIMIICLFTGFLTPLGTTPYTYLIKTMQGSTTHNISEHLPLTLVNNLEFMCTLVLFIAILTFTDTKIRLSDLFMLGGLVLLTFYTRRQFSMFTLICVIILNRLINALLDKYDPEGCKKAIKKMTTITGMIVTICLVLTISVIQYKPKMNDHFIDENSYPVGAATYILENLDIKNIKLYNEYNYGSYLIFRGIPVFIDSRADLYAPEFNPGVEVFNDYINLSNVDIDNVEEKLDKYGITHMLMYKKSKLRKFVEQNTEKYNLLYEDDNFCLFERKQVKESV